MFRNWTDAEKQIIKDRYPELGPRGCAPLLPGREPIAIRDKARKMRVLMTEEAKAKLRANQSSKPLDPGANRKPEPPKDIKADHPEYLQASDIFQVGYRFAVGLGVLSQFSRGAA